MSVTSWLVIWCVVPSDEPWLASSRCGIRIGQGFGMQRGAVSAYRIDRKIGGVIYPSSLVEHGLLLVQETQALAVSLKMLLDLSQRTHDSAG